MKNIHPEMKVCEFVCATCGSKFDIKTTLKVDTYPIDVCSKCHSFYIGKLSNKQLRGKSEKLIAKFETAKANLENQTKKTTKKVRIKKQKENSQGLESL